MGGDNEGLLLAEVELESATQKISLPSWIGEEVSEDPRYFNVNLVKNPFIQWYMEKYFRTTIYKHKELKK